MSHCNAAEMDHGRNPIGNDSNTSSSRIGIGINIGTELQQHNHVAADIASKSLNIESKAAPFTATSTQRYCDLFPAQNNGTSSESTTALNASKTNRRQETTIVQSQNNTPVPAAEVAANPKKARQRLRKGKWTIEEEEYTSRTIQYFSTGLLTLPDGATLRSYLAEKLNCDPMRITKKFTGACCLGRRAYHLRDRPRASPAEMDMASFELLHLEQRFRLRVDHEQTGLSLPPRHELLASQPPAAAVVSDVFPSLFSLQQGAPSVKATIPWIQNPVIVPSPGQPSFIPGLAGILPNVTSPVVGINLNAPNSSLLLAAGQLLLQNPSERTQAGNPAAAAAAPLQMLNNIVASLAFSQALNQQAGISLLQPAGSNISPSSSAAATTISSNCAPPTSTFNFSAPNITAHVNRKSPPIPISIPIPVVVSQEQRPEKVQLYQQQQQQQQLQKNNLSSSTAPISKKEEHTKKLKAAFEEQQRALRLAYEKSLQDAQEREEQSFASDLPAVTSDPTGRKPTTSANCTSSNFNISPDTASPAEQLQRSYEAHLASLQRAEQQPSFKTPSKSAPPASSVSVLASRIETERVKTKVEEKFIKEKTPDEEAGTILLGFLNSLRESYEDAVESKCGSKGTKRRNGYASKIKNAAAAIPVTESISTARIESSTVMTELSSDSSNRHLARRNNNNHGHSHVSINSRRQTSDPITSLSHFQTSKQMVKPASVTETSSSTSSQPTIEQSSSSQEDSKSDKMGHSSSEESEKEITPSRRMSRGPPRKRLKGFHEAHEFTRENLMAHSKRMDRECEESGDASSSKE